MAVQRYTEMNQRQISDACARMPAFANALVQAERVRAEMEANRLLFSQRKAEAPWHGHPDYPRRAALQIATRTEKA